MPVPVYASLPEGKSRIFCKAGWYEDAPIEAKMTPGARWDKESKSWTYPLTMESCRQLRTVYGDRLKVDSRLSAWARNAIRLENEMRHLGTAIDAKLEVVPQIAPFMAKSMEARTYQKSGAAYIAKGRRVLLADEVGLGKTITSLAGIIEAGAWAGNHLVISNKTSLESVWMDQIRKWTEGKAKTFVCDGPAKARHKTIEDFIASDAESKWLIINPAMLMIKLEEYCKKCKKFVKDISKDVSDPEGMEHFTLAHKITSETSVHKYPELQEKIVWDAIVVDEAHKVMSTGISSTNKNKLTQTALGLKSLQESRGSIRLALTGTPARGKELNLWGIMNWLWPETYSSKWAWIETFFHTEKNFFGTKVGGMRDEMEEAFFKMLDKHMIRRTRREVRGDLPEGVSMVEWVSMSPKHEKFYKEFESTGEVALENGEDLLADGILAELTRLRQMAYGVWTQDSKGKLTPTAVSPKLERLEDMLEERGLTGDKDAFRAGPHYKYVVASQFTEIVDYLEEHFNAKGIETLKITGAVTGHNRSKAVRSFHEDPDGPRLLVMNTAAGGESITIDGYCDTMFILDETFIADDNSQLYGRIDNRSVTAEEAVPRYFIHIATKGTIDEAMYENNVSQLEMEHKLLDARRGLEYARTLVREHNAA